MQTAELFDSGELATILRQEPDRVGSAVQSAAHGSRLDVLEFVLRHEPRQWDLDVALSAAATRRGSAAFVRTLLAAGARPASERWRCPLWNAATVGDADTVRLLLEAGADPNARMDDHANGPDGCCLPLVGAVRADAHAVVAALLDGGADPNVLTDALCRPLDIALETGSTAMAELLSARGATVFAPAEADLVQAIRRGFLPRVRELLPTQDPATQGRALISAVQERQTDIAVEILGHGEVGPDDLAMALGQAIALNAPQVVPHLIAAGVDPDATGNVYRTPPIVLAADRGHAQVVRDLLDAGADIQARDLDGRNALAAARERGRTEIVRLLGTAGGTARTRREITQAAKAKLAHVARLTWSPLLGAADGDGHGEPGASRFGGLPWLGAEEPWPLCADCAAPLTFFVQLDLAAVPEKARNLGTGLLQLFHCTACNPFRAFSGGHLVRIVEVSGEASWPTPPDGVRRFPERPIAGWARAVRDYPYREADEPELLPEERAVVFGLNRQGDKLGGWPNWVQDPQYPDCPRGDGRMTQPVLQIDSRRGIPHMWGDNGAGYIVQCPAHRDQVAFLWQSA